MFWEPIVARYQTFIHEIFWKLSVSKDKWRGQSIHSVQKSSSEDWVGQPDSVFAKFAKIANQSFMLSYRRICAHLWPLMSN